MLHEVSNLCWLILLSAVLKVSYTQIVEIRLLKLISAIAVIVTLHVCLFVWSFRANKERGSSFLQVQMLVEVESLVLVVLVSFIAGNKYKKVFQIIHCCLIICKKKRQVTCQTKRSKNVKTRHVLLVGKYLKSPNF